MIHIVAIHRCINVDEAIYLEQSGVGGVILIRGLVVFFDRLLLLHFDVRHSFLFIVVVAASFVVPAAATTFEIPLLNQLRCPVDLFLYEVWALAAPPGVTSLAAAVAYRFGFIEEEASVIILMEIRCSI